MDRAQGPTVDFFPQNLPGCDLSLTHQVEPRGPPSTHLWQARGSTGAYVQVHRRVTHGHQGIRHISPCHREAECFMGPHVLHLTCLGASVLTPASHSLRTAPRGPVWPMHHIDGLCMCRADQWLAIGLHTIQWTTEAWLAAAGHTSHGVWCGLA